MTQENVPPKTVDRPARRKVADLSGQARESVDLHAAAMSLGLDTTRLQRNVILCGKQDDMGLLAFKGTSSLTSSIATDALLQDPILARQLLESLGLPLCQGVVLTAAHVKKLSTLVDSLRFPLLVEHGGGTSRQPEGLVANDASELHVQVEGYFSRSKGRYSRLIVTEAPLSERNLVLVVGDRVVAWCSKEGAGERWSGRRLAELKEWTASTALAAVAAVPGLAYGGVEFLYPSGDEDPRIRRVLNGPRLQPFAQGNNASVYREVVAFHAELSGLAISAERNDVAVQARLPGARDSAGLDALTRRIAEQLQISMSSVEATPERFSCQLSGNVLSLSMFTAGLMGGGEATEPVVAVELLHLG